ncbi:hypothetical protein HK102_000356 [Quaeritorhiza haematococci]|nr:hypothetical protein HK102_000356 [Quaeritorhiza haematococci]
MELEQSPYLRQVYQDYEAFVLQDILWFCWMLGGCEAILYQLRWFLDNLPILTLVIDATSRNRNNEALNEINFVVNELKKCAGTGGNVKLGDPYPKFKRLVFLLNKVDHENAMEVEDILLRIRQIVGVPEGKPIDNKEEQRGNGAAAVVDDSSSQLTGSTAVQSSTSIAQPAGGTSDPFDWVLIPCIGTTGQGIQEYLDVVYEHTGLTDRPVVPISEEKSVGNPTRARSSWSFKFLKKSRKPTQPTALFQAAPQVQIKDPVSSFVPRRIYASQVDWEAVEAWSTERDRKKEEEVKAKAEAEARNKENDAGAKDEVASQVTVVEEATENPTDSTKPESQQLQSPATTTADPSPTPSPFLKRFQETSDIPSSPDAFLEEFEKGEFSGRFDHRAHLRSAFLLIVRERKGRKVVDSEENAKGTTPEESNAASAPSGESADKKGTEEERPPPVPPKDDTSGTVTAQHLLTHILTSYSNMFAVGIAKGTLTNRFHHTMTHFWAYSVLEALLRAESKCRLAKTNTGGEHGGEGEGYFSADEFAVFLEENLDLMDSSSWTKHFSRDLMFSDEARGKVVKPDEKELPKLVL